MRLSWNRLLLVVLLPAACNEQDEPEQSGSCEESATADRLGPCDADGGGCRSTSSTMLDGGSSSDLCENERNARCVEFRDSLIGRVSEYSLRGRLVAIECDDRTCTADVIWPTYVSAVQEYGILISGGSCETSAMLSDPADVCDPYLTTLHADCGG